MLLRAPDVDIIPISISHSEDCFIDVRISSFYIFSKIKYKKMRSSRPQKARAQDTPFLIIFGGA
jgi:hypothetical protein